MSDRSKSEAAAAHVESSESVGRRAARGRRCRSSSRAPSGQTYPSSDISHPREVTMDTVSTIVSEIKNHLSALFNELRLASSPPVDEQFATKRDGNRNSVESSRSGVPYSLAGTQVTTCLPPQSAGWQGANSLQDAEGAFPPTAIPVKQVCSQDSASRADDWIDSLTLDGRSAADPVPAINHLPFNALQQLGPSVKIEPFDGDPRQWETFIGSFKALVHDVVQSNAQRVAILSQLLSPRLRSSLGNCLHSPEMYPEALANLRQLFGDPSRALDMHIHTLLNIAPMKSNSKEEVERFFFEVRGAVSTFRALGSNVELQSKATLHSVSTKLTYKLKTMWARRAFDLLPKIATLADFDKWLEEMVIVQNSVGDSEVDSSQAKKLPRRLKSTRQVNTLTSSTGTIVCRICELNHPLEQCPQFLSLSLLRRAETLKNFGLCFACFDPSHRARFCRSRRRCGVDGCRLRHHPLLHGAPRVYAQPPAQKEERSATKSCPSSESTMIGTTVTNASEIVLLSVVPVVAASGDRVVSTYALLDTGSEGSLITEKLARQLRLAKDRCQLRLSTFHGQDPPQELFKTTFQLRSVRGEKTFDIKNAIVVPSLNVSNRIIDWSRIKGRLDHLNDLPLVKIDYAHVELLLGADNFDAIQPLELRRPARKGQPYGVKTPLGWTVCGRFSLSKEERILHSIQINRVTIKAAEDETPLLETLEKFWSTESFGTKPNSKLPVSPEVEYAQRLLSSSTAYFANRFSVGLLWKPGLNTLPNNRPLALNRFLVLRKRLRANPALQSMYRNAMDDLFRRNIASEVPQDKLGLPAGRVWYLPHHGVCHPNKPNKLRIVFDASAKFDGTSLNDHLTKGPDLTNSLVGILIRFRRYNIPIVSDVEKMFHQVAVPEADRSVLRFLWTNSDEGAPRTFQMNRQVFGLTSAPASCMYALKCAIETFAPAEVTARCQRQFYVDNYLDSFEFLEDASRVAKNLKKALMEGGFILTKWSSSKTELLERFPETDRSDGIVNLRLSDIPLENVLGLLWDQRSDSFRFASDIDSRNVNTKRQMLSAIASLYDPLGFLAPVIVTAKLLMRESICLNTDWDEDLDKKLSQKFQDWSSKISSIRSLQIPRWLSLSSEVAKIELHSFSDASETAFGAVVYLRTISTSGTVNVSFLIAKTRIAPRRPLTIPRLELQAAVMAVRLVDTVKQEMGLPVDRTVYWTDSTTVLHWLHVPARMRSFVIHRIAEILEFSEAKNWRYVPGNLNPADDASRGLPANKLHDRHRWFLGPHFLIGHESTWPKNIIASLSEEAVLETLEPTRWVGAMSAAETNCVLHLIDVTSSYKRILRIMAYVCRFAYRRRGGSETLDADEIQVAQWLCVRIVQNSFLGNEIADMRKGRKVNESSKLIGLDPFLDEQGLIRVGGRIRRADVDLSTKHPVVLPGESSLAHRIVWQRHLDLMHAGTERVLADLRAEFWITGGRRLVRRVIGKCLYCRKLSAVPKQIMMSDLPSERLDFHAPAFTNVGIDFFGPFEVIVKRSREKRYGCIFTCLVSRAVHLELTPSLNLNSVILAVKRFISRRGRPKIIMSDNGSSFVKAAKCFRQEWSEVDIDGLSTSLADLRIKWKFSPPHGPHFGGAWERLIGVAKRALCATLHGNHCTDEVLATIFAEVEALLNGRPLCYIGEDPSNPEPLTPFMLLTGRSNINVPVDVTCGKECTSNKHWCYAQKIADRFWQRWRKEYLPTLQQRSRWTKDTPNVKVGDVVVIVEPQQPRGHWPLGRITHIVEGTDGRVRIATVKTKNRSYVRPVTRLALIESLG